ncbi:AAA family ATPase [Lawsonibacter faecis]|uniref:AAA family ATPase n=1 Tax=Lawsonibacter faecis TaxID=2763052 RepID=A0A8J6MBY2_9FIRM|nr:AAA family ATPase [Lawsonibacter faecis]MBC5736100.1 AAA family ATPase [Lawsonibacter faecis]
MSNSLPSASEWLAYEPFYLDPSLPTGFWLCSTPEDALAVKVNAGCLRTTATWEDLPRCEKFLASFPYVLIVCPDRKLRTKMAAEARERLPGLVLLVANDSGFRKCATLQELRDQYGLKSLDHLLLDTTELPGFGLLDLADVVPPDISKMPKVRTGIAKLDNIIGGYYLGELSIWTGKRGEGKSTFLDQMLLESIDQAVPVCAYSGELQAWKFKYWATLQAAGPKNITQSTDPQSGKVIPGVNPFVQRRIDEWWRGRFLLYDIGKSARHDIARILKAFDYARKRYGAKVFLVDNLMTARYKGVKDSDYYRAQSNFVGELASFAKGYDVHVHLVAHPRKTDKPLDNDAVSGIGDITNMADNVFSMERTDQGGNGGDSEYEGTKSGTVLTILKNRFFGETQRSIGLDFDKKSKRFYKSGGGTPHKAYGWEFDGEEQPSFLDDGAPVEDPFDDSKKGA